MTSEQKQKIETLLGLTLEELPLLTGFEVFKLVSKLFIGKKINRTQHDWLLDYYRKLNPIKKEEVENIVEQFNQEEDYKKDITGKLVIKTGSVSSNILQMLKDFPSDDYFIKGEIINMYRDKYPEYRYAETIGRKLRLLEEEGFLDKKYKDKKVYYKII